MSHRLQQLLQEYAADGEWHSTGLFSLDDERARDILVRFQSNNPDLFLLHWVRFTTLSQARRSWIEWQGPELILSHDGEWPRFEAWSTLWGQQQLRERALAFCLWNAVHVRFEKARLVSASGQLELDEQLKTQFYSPEERPLLPWESPQSDKSGYLALTLSSKNKNKTGMSLPPLGPDQRAMLEERCSYSPVQMHYLGQEIARAEPVASIFHSFFQGNEELLPVRWPSYRGKEASLAQKVRSPYQASVHIGVQDGRQGLAVVLDGVSYLTCAPKGLPRLFIVLSAPDLSLDISGEHLVHTKTLVSLREWLERDLDGFFRLVIRDLDRAPAGLVPYLESFISVRLKSRDYSGAYQICRWVLRKIGTPANIAAEQLRGSQFLNEWQRAAFLFRFALISELMKDEHSARCLREQAERVWAEAPLKEPRWLPRAEVPEGQLSLPEKVLLCRLAVEEQTLEESFDLVRKTLDDQADQFRQQGRWNLVVYCHRWLLEMEQTSLSKGGEPRVGRKGLSIRRALVGIATIRHLREKSTPLSQDWYEAQVYLNQALTGWKSQLERQANIHPEDRITLLEILDAQINIHLALGQREGALRIIEVWLEEQMASPGAMLEECLDHLQRLRKSLGSHQREQAAELEARGEEVKRALREARPRPLDLFVRFFRRKRSD